MMGSYGIPALTLLKSDILESLDSRAKMRIISFIEDEEVIKKTLKDLGPCLVKEKPLPRADALGIVRQRDYSNPRVKMPVNTSKPID